MTMPVFQWNFARALQNMPYYPWDRMEPIVTRGVTAVTAAWLGLGLANNCIRFVCDSCWVRNDASFDGAIRACEEKWPQETLVDPTCCPLDWKNGTFDECVTATYCDSIPENQLCKSVRSGVDFIDGIINPVAQKVFANVGNFYILRPVAMGLVGIINQIAARRGP